MGLKEAQGGLTVEEAKQALQKFGFNELKEKKKTTVLDVFVRQFNNFIIYVLLAAAVISLLVGELVNFFVIVAIILFVVILGFIQEYRAEKTIAALKNFVKPTSRVLRSGAVQVVPGREIVPGDVILLETGDKVPADCKLLEIVGLKVDESMLTGESFPVEKKAGDEIYAGTSIVHGRCKALVTKTGMSTKLGSIAEMVQVEESETPLQRRINHLSKLLAGLALGVCLITFIVGLYRGAPLVDILIIAIALAVAAVPEGLALTLTLTLAFGMQKMAEHNAVMRKMLAVETLGSVTVIATDKTGTLTKNEMVVEQVYADGKVFKVTGEGYVPKGTFTLDGAEVDSTQQVGLTNLLRASALCTSASLEKKDNEWKGFGDPTEIAILVAAAKADQWKDDLETDYKLLEELVFSSESKVMTTIHADKANKGGKVAFMKGAPEVVIAKCKFIEKNGKIVKLTSAEAKKLLEINEGFSSNAFRSLAVAYAPVKTKKQLSSGLIFLGLVAMRDPPREEVLQAIAECKQAGIKVVMITGDNKDTAFAIGRQVGLTETVPASVLASLPLHLQKVMCDSVITGEELNSLSDADFAKIVNYVSIYARAAPEQKLRIVTALKQQGHIVAMTGDGVNDAPALKKADIGVAMGLKGTDVAKEASAMVLHDDNFATIVSAVRQGRTIYRNIEKFTSYLISRNFTEVILILLGLIFLGFDYLPLLALQILFINTFDEVIPAISLGLDPTRSEIMKQKPRNPSEQLLKKRNVAIILSTAAFIALSVFFVFLSSDPVGDIGKARTVVFASIISTILFIPLAFRSLHETVIDKNIFSNKLMVFGTISTFLVTVIAMYTPFFQEIFHLTPLGAMEWILPLSVGIATFAFVEIIKAVLRRFKTQMDETTY